MQKSNSRSPSRKATRPSSCTSISHSSTNPNARALISREILHPTTSSGRPTMVVSVRANASLACIRPLCAESRAPSATTVRNTSKSLASNLALALRWISSAILVTSAKLAPADLVSCRKRALPNRKGRSKFKSCRLSNVLSLATTKLLRATVGFPVTFVRVASTFPHTATNAARLATLPPSSPSAPYSCSALLVASATTAGP